MKSNEVLKAYITSLVRGGAIKRRGGSSPPKDCNDEVTDLNIMDWWGYGMPELWSQYKKSYGAVEPIYDYFNSEKDAIIKLNNGFEADLIHPCTTSLRYLKDNDKLIPIDTSRLKNWKNINKIISGQNEDYPEFNDFNDGKQQWAIPFDWGTTNLYINKKKVREIEDVASDVLDGSISLFKDQEKGLKHLLSPKWRGQIIIVDNVLDAYALGFIATGKMTWPDDNSWAEDAHKASLFLQNLHPNVHSYQSLSQDAGSLLVTGEVSIVWGWNEIYHVIQMDANLLGDSSVADLIEIPSWSSGSVWVCGYSILKRTNQICDKKIYDFLDSILSEETASFLSREWGYGHSNTQITKNTINMDFEKIWNDGGFAQVSLSSDKFEQLQKDFISIKDGRGSLGKSHFS